MFFEYFLLTVIKSSFAVKKLSSSTIYTLLLCLYHLLFAGIAYYFVLERGGDAQHYWFVGEDLENRNWLDFLRPGTPFIQFFTFPFTRYLHLPFWFGFFLFSIIGLGGILIFKKWGIQLLKNQPFALLLFHLFLFFPGLHFWTSMIGKEAPEFLCLALLVNQIIRKKWSFTAATAFAILLFIRPHHAVLFAAALCLTLLIDPQFNRRIKGYAAAFWIGCTGLAYLLLLQMQDFSGGFVTSVLRKYTVHTEYLKSTTSYVPLDQYSLPGKIFTFWFRPLPFERKGTLYTIWSLENLFFLACASTALILFLRHLKNRTWNFTVFFLLFWAFLYTLIFSYAYANYGLIYRTKILLLPFLTVIFLQFLPHNRTPVKQ